jgi:hypothetical protein
MSGEIAHGIARWLETAFYEGMDSRSYTIDGERYVTDEDDDGRVILIDTSGNQYEIDICVTAWPSDPKPAPVPVVAPVEHQEGGPA